MVLEEVLELLREVQRTLQEIQTSFDKVPSVFQEVLNAYHERCPQILTSNDCGTLLRKSEDSEVFQELLGIMWILVGRENLNAEDEDLPLSRKGNLLLEEEDLLLE